MIDPPEIPYSDWEEEYPFSGWGWGDFGARALGYFHPPFYRICPPGFGEPATSLPKSLSYLPNPYNMGDDWYKEAIWTIKRDRDSWLSWKLWEGFWMGTMVFQDNLEEFRNFRIEWAANWFSDFIGISGL
jgi:hypothetical protein